MQLREPQLAENSPLAHEIRRHLAERQERELLLLGLMRDMLDLLRLLRAHLPGEGLDEERPRPN